MKRYNLHNHSTFSDGSFTPEEIVRAAALAGLEGIGISDHFFTPKVHHGLAYEAWLGVTFEDYLKMATTLRQQAPAGLKVWVGIEIDSCLRRLGLKLKELPWERLNTLDYVLVEYLGEGDLEGLALSDLGELRSYCKVPLILAHPNVERLIETAPLNLVVEILRQKKVALEVPAGTRNEWFWNRIDPSPLRRVQLTIGTDTHHDLSEVSDITRAITFLEKTGLDKNLVTPDTLATATGGVL